MVLLDESSIVEEDGDVDSIIETVAKYEKAHTRPIVGLWSFKFGGQIGFITVSHDSAKLWALEEDKQRKHVKMIEKATLAKWRSAVQSADVTNDGKYLVVIGIDSIVHEIFLDNEISYYMHDFGYMEAMHLSIASTKNTYITTSFSGKISEIEVGKNTFYRREPFSNYKLISCIAYSNDMKYLAVGQNDGVIDLFETSTLKMCHKFEVHSMKIRKLVFLPGDERFISACDDKLIKMNSLIDFKLSETNRTMKPIRIFAAHNGPVISLAVDERSGGTRFASSSSTGQIFIWHVEMATPICDVQNDHEALISGLSFSPSGRHLFSAGDDSLICCYRVPASGETSPLPEEEEEIQTQNYYPHEVSVSYSEDAIENTQQFVQHLNINNPQFYGQENPKNFSEINNEFHQIESSDVANEIRRNEFLQENIEQNSNFQHYNPEVYRQIEENDVELNFDPNRAV